MEEVWSSYSIDSVSVYCLTVINVWILVPAYRIVRTCFVCFSYLEGLEENFLFFFPQGQISYYTLMSIITNLFFFVNTNYYQLSAESWFFNSLYDNFMQWNHQGFKCIKV